MQTAINLEILAGQFYDYFVSLYENTIYELLMFSIIAIMVFIFYEFYRYNKMEELRKQFSFVIGGWGTRGKSSVERLKAALINALGYSLISKTTGSEAMLVMSPEFGELKEISIFRPYDRVSIWEQYDILNLAAKFKYSTFLWECMAVTPDYVKIIQQKWMHDDLSTITNAFPDHEDKQGPSARDVAYSIAQFVPLRAKLLTSEEQMLPILKLQADQNKTPVTTANWIDVGLITPDVINYFHYIEHPQNIALLLKLAKELDVSESFALKEMADRVIPDLGVLKTYPKTTVKTRTLEFNNGMSANDRVSTLDNWYRLGFDQCTIDQKPDTFVTALVNNRADRVARSQSFASILVNDISVDALYCIGTNLSGLRGYIDNAWDEKFSNLDLWVKGQRPTEAFTRLCKKFKVPYTNDIVIKRLETMLNTNLNPSEIPNLIALWQDPEALYAQLKVKDLPYADLIVKQLRHDLEYYQAAQKWFDLLGNPSIDQRRTDADINAFLKRFFNSKFVMIDELDVHPEKLLHIILDNTPPGFYNRILGMQNIKGPGLAFVHQWQIWEKCYRSIVLLTQNDKRRIKFGLQDLLTISEFSILCQEPLEKVLEELKSRTYLQQEDVQAMIDIIYERLESSILEMDTFLSQQKNKTWFSAIFAFFESFIDPGYALSRKKKAEKIYLDLVNHRISSIRAAREIQNIYREQEGGYLYHRFSRLFTKQ